jgi:hypothetical protein
LSLYRWFNRFFGSAFARKLKACFPADRVELLVAAGARHSESSFDPAYPEAARRFILRHLQGVEDVGGPA